MPFSLKQTTQQKLINLSFIATLACSMSLPAQAANITGITAAPNPFNPSESESTTIFYTPVTSSLLWLRVYDDSGALKRTLVGNSSYTGPTSPEGSAGARTQTWNGRDDSNSLLPDGNYPYHFDDAYFSAHLTGGGQPHDIAVNPANPNIIWMTNKTGPYVYRSTNGGSSFTGVSGTGSSAKDYGIEVSDNGQMIFITDDGQSSLNRSTNGGSSWSTTGSFPGGAVSISDVAIKGDGTVVYALDYDQGRIYKSTNSGGSWSTCSASGLSLSTNARGIGTDRATGNTVIVTDSTNNRLFKSTNGCSSFSQISGISSGTAAGRVSYPYQVSIQSDGKFWVSERDNHRIQQFDANGTSLMVYGGSNTGAGNYQFNSEAKYFGIGLATISSQPYIFVADYGNTRIKRVGYDNWSSTTHLQISSSTALDTTSTGTASAVMASKTSIAVSMPYSDDGNGNNTYTVDYKRSSEPATWSNWVTNASHSASPYITTITGLIEGESYDVRMTYNDADGVTGSNPQTLFNIIGGNLSGVSATPNPFNPNNETTTLTYSTASDALLWLKIYNNSGQLKRKLIDPTIYTAVNTDGVSGSHNKVWDGRDSLANILPDGQYPYTIDDAFFDAHLTLGAAGAPRDVAVDPTDSQHIWMTNTSANYLWESTNGGSSWVSRNVGLCGAGAYGIVTSADGQTIYVSCDGANVLRKSTNGGGSWVSTAAMPATTIADVATSADGQIVYALDYNNAIYVSSNAGASWGICGGFGLATSNPRGIATSADGATVLIADSGNNKIWSGDCHNFFFEFSGISTGTPAGKVSYPYQIALQPDGKFWVSERDNHRIQQFDENGESLMVYGGTASGSGNFRFNVGASSFFGIGLDSASAQPHILVADYGNTRIKKVGYDNFSSASDLLIVSAPPSVPDGLSGGDRPGDNGGAINLAWTVSTADNVLQQRIYRSTFSGGGYTLLTTIANNTTNSYTDTTAANGITYYYIIRAFNGSLESVNSNQTSATALDNIAASSPGGLSATAGDSEVPLSWTVSSSNDVTQQRIYRSTTSGSGYVLLASINNNSTNSYVDTSVTNGTTYYYVIRAFDGTSESVNSNQGSATPSASIVNAPSALTANAPTGSDQVNLSWTVSTSSGVTQQRIYRRQSNQGYSTSPIATISNNSANSYSDTTAADGIQYFYIVRAFRSGIESANSNESSATISPNLAPVASDALLAVLRNTTGFGTLRGSDGNDDPITFSIVANGSLGNATITNASTGAYQYVPNTNATGTDTILFRVNDGNENSNTATLTVMISATVPPSEPVNNGFEMISIPTHLIQETDFFKLFQDDLGAAPFVYKFVSSGPAATFNGQYKVATKATAGVGYWLYVQTLDGPRLDDDFNGENLMQCDPVNFPGTQCVDIALSAGGNLIGNPYPTNKLIESITDVEFCNRTATPGCDNGSDWVSFSAAVSNGWIMNTLYHWNSSSKSYDAQSLVDVITVRPWQGYFMRVDSADTIIMRFYR